jgi:class 3 adenylate cyclase
MGVHTGEAVERDSDYFGPAVNRAVRIMALAHGGQVLLSVCLVDSTDRVDLDEHRLRGPIRPERLYQVVHPACRDGRSSTQSAATATAPLATSRSIS